MAAALAAVSWCWSSGTSGSIAPNAACPRRSPSTTGPSSESPGRFQGYPSRGDRFVSDAHPYSSDLGIFGEASLFQLLDATHTRSGEDCLGKWLGEPSETSAVLARQECRSRSRLTRMLARRAGSAGHADRQGRPPKAKPGQAGLRALFSNGRRAEPSLSAAPFVRRSFVPVSARDPGGARARAGRA